MINSRQFHQNTIYISYGLIRPCYICCITLQIMDKIIAQKQLSFLKLQLDGIYSIKTVAILLYNTVNISYKYCIDTIVSEQNTMHICLSNEVQLAKFTIPASQSHTVHLLLILQHCSDNIPMLPILYSNCTDK